MRPFLTHIQPASTTPTAPSAQPASVQAVLKLGLMDEKSPLLTSARFGQEPHFRGEKRQQNKSVTMPRAER
jgi:hypothetical protein